VRRHHDEPDARAYHCRSYHGGTDDTTSHYAGTDHSSAFWFGLPERGLYGAQWYSHRHE
jgi:hypothetical protein